MPTLKSQLFSRVNSLSAGFVLIAIPLALYLLLILVTAILSLITFIRVQHHRDFWRQFRSSIFSGRVSHARFLPCVHAFSYPLFFFFLDLSETDKLFGRKFSHLWPLCWVMSFRESDHLKNGEGLLSAQPKGSATINITSIDNSLSARIQRLVHERTNGNCQLTSTNPILLLTHLSYYGYCFNPVSFYYILKSKTDYTVEAIVAEVSNTPWLEMKCYVLHPNSVDMKCVQEGRARMAVDSVLWERNPSLEESCEILNEKDDTRNNQTGAWKSINYIFQKSFHVSPFMDLNYIYDWTFWIPTHNRISVSTTMKKEHCLLNNNGLESVETTKHFNAFFDVRRVALTPFILCRQLIRLPLYCVIIQLWIHYEAMRLFIKGVEFIPHPNGTETVASKVIGSIMTPFFMVKDLLGISRSDKSVAVLSVKKTD